MARIIGPCVKCGRFDVEFMVSDKLWNIIIGKEGIICCACFEIEAKQKHIPLAWYASGPSEELSL